MPVAILLSWELLTARGRATEESGVYPPQVRDYNLLRIIEERFGV
jgi:hypothetical protein